MEILDIITSLISGGVAITVLLTAIARLVPNNKLFEFGVKLGKNLNNFGSGKLGNSWEKIEDFLINSLGVLLNGIKNGLEFDEKIDGKLSSNNYSKKKENDESGPRI